MQLKRNKGLADWLFIAIIVGLNFLGYGAVIATKQADSPIEQVAESLLKQAGQEVDFSAKLKRDEDGKLHTTQVKVQTTKPS